MPKLTAEEAVPARLARVMIEQKPQPPPPPPPAPKVEPKKIEPDKKVDIKPIDKTEQARKKAEKRLAQVKDELADLRQLTEDQPIGPTKNLTGAVGADTHAERSLITSKVGVGSAGITSANSSRGFGTGAGSLTGVSTTAVSSSIVASGRQCARPDAHRLERQGRPQPRGDRAGVRSQ